jgi:hypothetical protein
MMQYIIIYIDNLDNLLLKNFHHKILMITYNMRKS